MRDHLGSILKYTCYALAALLLYQLVVIVVRVNPLTRVKIPELPSLPASMQPAPKGTNSAISVASLGKGSNQPPGSASTNVVTSTAPARTNGSPPSVSTDSNSAPRQLAASTNTNSVSPRVAAVPSTNAAPSLASDKGTNTSPVASGTNSLLPHDAGRADLPVGPDARYTSNAFGAGRVPTDPMAPMRELPSLSPELQARVNRVIDSEFLGPVIRPLPLALLGIAGDFAFLRATNGQTGLVKEGDQLTGIKLLRIGTNRVLVELDGQKKELTIFSGYGGESLLPEQETHP